MAAICVSQPRRHFAGVDERAKSVGAGRERYAGWQSGPLFSNGKAPAGGFRHRRSWPRQTLAPRVRFWARSVRAARTTCCCSAITERHVGDARPAAH